MTENLIDVYDVLHPSPPTLKRIALISVALELWRHEISEYRAANSLDTLELKKKISPSALKTLLLPKLFNDIEEYTKKVGKSIDDWLEHHCQAILDFHRDDANDILRDFDDFVCDFDGGIHLGRTAERLMLCDRFSIDEKFKIACTHCFEDDVERIWPLVSTRVNLDDIDFEKHAILYYWICRLTDQLYRIPRYYYSGPDETIEEIMFLNAPDSTWNITSVYYLWNRLPPDIRWGSAVLLQQKNILLFCRYILAKLHDEKIDEMWKANGSVNLLTGLILLPSGMPYVLPVWTLLKPKVNEDNFCIFIRIFLVIVTCCGYNEWSFVGREIWESAPTNLKRAMIRDLLHGRFLLVKKKTPILIFRIVSLMLAILEDISFEERKAFWHKHWRDLIDIYKTEDLSILMHFCINDENEMIRFKESTLSNYEIIGSHCSVLLKNGCFEELEKYLKFCCSTEQAGRDIMLKVLENDRFELSSKHINNAEMFDEFVKYLFNNDEDEICNYKINLSSTFDTCDGVEAAVLSGDFRHLMNFIDRFVVSNEKAIYLKKIHFPDIFARHLTNGVVPDIKHDELSIFIRWCFENNEDDVAKFKQTLPMDKLIEKILRREISVRNSEGRVPRRKRRMRYSCKLDRLLEWYFVIPESVQEWKAKCAELFESLFEEMNRWVVEQVE